MNANRFYAIFAITTFFSCLLNIATVLSQNVYPTAKGTNVKIDGGAIDYAAPVTTGGWARGIRFYNSDMSTHFFGMGMLGSANLPTRFYMGFHAQSPWESQLGLHILANGNVGVGITNPLARLAVNGNILAKEIKIKTDITVPDYVFDPNYQLPSLSSIEDYVKKHRHLPEIPSANEIQKDGVDLTAMNLALLKKVEELTLHLIAKEKEIDELKETQRISLQELSERLNKLEK
ncbi:MAG: hypothetical protein LBF27_06760 [Sphingobacterium sp.]|jgi:hypothetical protein|nr:hypothetical protein [Sphingobacterium sp.]